MMNFGSKIVSMGHAVPEKVMTNDDFAKIVETNDEWIRTRTGIRERRFFSQDKGKYISDYCYEAAQVALKRAGWKAEDLDLVICNTMSPETLMPNNACRVLGKLGIKNITAFDQSAACSGFLVGLHTVDALMKAGSHKRAMVFGAEALSSAINFKDRTTCVLFGDGAACALIERIDNPDPQKDSMILGTVAYAYNDENEDLVIQGGGSRMPAHDPRAQEGDSAYLKMNGQEIFKAGTRGMAKAAQDVMKKCGIGPGQIKWFVPHQANLRMIEMVAKLMDFPMEKVYVNVDRWGNTSSATIPICLSEMEEKGLLNRGDIILLDVFGGGFSYGAALVRW